MTLPRELNQYEIEVGEALAARRDTAERLVAVLTVDLSRFDEVMTAIDSGRAMDILGPAGVGQVRQAVSDAIVEFESARHRFRLALVALAVDNGMNARRIAEAFAFSRQLASRYLKEARLKWPELNPSSDDEDGESASGDQPEAATSSES